MPSSADVAAEIERMLAPLPVGFSVSVQEETQGIIIGNEALGFAISKTRVDDGGAIAIVRKTWPELLTHLSELYRLEAEKFRTATQQDMTVDVDVD